MTGKPSYRELYGYLPHPCVQLLESGKDGEELMLRVVAKLGGMRVRIPAKLRADHKLVKALGAREAARVAAIWRGRGAGEIAVDVPRMTAAAQKARRQKLLSLIGAGVTVAAAAFRLGITERSAYYMLARSREVGEIPPDPQGDLFAAA